MLYRSSGQLLVLLGDERYSVPINFRSRISSLQTYPVPSSDKILALSCTNVGVGPGGTTAMLARVSVVDYKGQVILDTYVSPTMQVSDYRTATTADTPAFTQVQQHVADLIKGKVLVGHSLWNDLSVLGIPHPAVATRDVALYQPFRNVFGPPNQVENARAALDLYRTVSSEWEGAIAIGNWPSCLPPSTFSRCYL
ncbi:hypothetical protein EDD22DRAFT_981468 [Suillus occidentalis]|nr:hypothetical protein EDD22DRAFT_981468 [Suillus occidentalis]